MKRITIKDIAEELGISARAVSQALNPRESNVKLSASTVTRVQALAAKLNYRPDSRARAMRYGRFNNIGFFEAKKKSDSWPLLGAEAGVFDVASDHHYRVTLIRLPTDLSEQANPIPSVFREGNLDALVLSHAGNLSAELEEVLDRSGFPIIYLNEKKKNNAVYVDDRRGMLEITQYILSLGKRRVVFLRSSDRGHPHYSVGDRAKGYVTAMEAAGLKPEIIEFDERNENWEADFAQWFRKNKKCEAVLAYNDMGAIHVMRYMRGSSYVVPDNLLVTGFGDDFGKEVSVIPLTTMKIPFYEMGRAATEMALELLTKGQESVKSRVFPTQLIVRESAR